tara:strand:+ start:11781 stop:12548 length:768 start_codon:yes stop_codon:yes gene_type:complete
MTRYFLGLVLLVTPALGQDLFTPALKQYGKTIKITSPIVVKSGDSIDGRLSSGKFTRYVADRKLMGDGSQKESQKPMFILEPGATLSNIILDTPSADGVHIIVANGKTTRLTNIQVRDVGEDALTIKSGSGGNVIISRCSFLKAADKVVQINAVTNLVIDECYGQNFGRFARTTGTGPNLDYRVSISNSGFRNGNSILKMTNSKSRGELKNVIYEDIDTPVIAENGAKADLDNVSENRRRKIRGFVDKILSAIEE